VKEKPVLDYDRGASKEPLFYRAMRAAVMALVILAGLVIMFVIVGLWMLGQKQPVK
jgi:hypothetical protein